MDGKNCVSWVSWVNWISYFYFYKKILKTFNNKTDIILFLICKLIFFSSALLLIISLLIFLSYNFFELQFIFYCSISFITMLIMSSNYNFISYIVKGIKASEKRLKLFEYLKNNINDNGFIFLQETHSLSNDELKWKDEFGGPLFFHTEKAILVGWRSAIVTQKILKW